VIYLNAGLHDLAHGQAENVAPRQRLMVPVELVRARSLDSYGASLGMIAERLGAPTWKSVRMILSPKQPVC
jgi:hypothetical protein